MEYPTATFLQLHILWKTAYEPPRTSLANSTVSSQPLSEPNKSRRLPNIVQHVRCIRPPSPRRRSSVTDTRSRGGTRRQGSAIQAMHEYSQRGRDKLQEQAARGHDEVRCPLDGAVMVVVNGVAMKMENGEPIYRDFVGRPRKSAWTVLIVEMECSACRRRIKDVAVNGAVADTSVAGTAPNVQSSR